MSRFTSIADELDVLVPPFDADGDWQDVVHRAAGPRGWRRRPRALAAAAVFAVLVALLATPAFGVQGFVLHLLGRKNVSFQKSKAAPNEIKKQFEDLALGAPAQWAPDALAAETRDAGTVLVAGHRRALYVVPTNKGGFCYVIQEAVGGCRQTAADRTGKFSTTWMEKGNPTIAGWPIVSRIAGDVTAIGAASITVHYADGATSAVPFIWVSKPIDAGFYSFDIPQSHQTVATRVRSVTVEARDGRQLGIQQFTYEHRTPPPTNPKNTSTPKQRDLAVTPPVAPSQPVVEATRDGFQVVVGHNGAVQFTQVGESPALRRLVGRSASFGCFRLTTEFGIFTARGLGTEGRFASKVGFLLSGVGRRVDGCEIDGSAGHLWPDVDGNHSAVEVPLTPAGRAFFANRAAARDLALFVRTRRVQRIRREEPAAAIKDLRAAYGKELAQSAIRMRVSNGTLVLSERSSIGKLFTVTVIDGRIVQQNLKPFALAF
ncbi:MAG TPA: hypothetical protein VHV52_02905 [Gaiellaceae bacterium]|nr:hypothetical protein [Gaiellaceae bacterium]